ncbi:MAG: type II toxin-antitoxin system prevent-host-death family antitoxin [Chthoniobacterales bacterium]|nr:type II toxin-antitoxin system prevent-host-death family antitoxin [Chthoniobacterales bacterium]
MLQANISTAKNNLCSFLEKVQRGETIIISDRNHPIAILSPYQATEVSKKWSERLALLSKNLKVTLPKISKKKKLRLPIVPNKPVHLLDALLEERRASR